VAAPCDLTQQQLPFVVAQDIDLVRCSGSYRVRVSLVRTALWLAELGIFDRDYAVKTAGSNDEHLYPDPDGFVVDTPMGRYTGVREMIEMSKTPGEYQHPLTPLGCWQPSWL
jgi:hypothetical protein